MTTPRGHLTCDLYCDNHNRHEDEALFSQDIFLISYFNRSQSFKNVICGMIMHANTHACDVRYPAICNTKRFIPQNCQIMVDYLFSFLFKYCRFQSFKYIYIIYIYCGIPSCVVERNFLRSNLFHEWANKNILKKDYRLNNF